MVIYIKILSLSTYIYIDLNLFYFNISNKTLKETIYMHFKNHN